MEIIYAADKDPDMESSVGKAWLFDDESLAKRKKMDWKKFASLRTWVIFAPWAHPLWSHYILSIVHLRPIDGMPPPVIHLHGATHELYLLALDPDHKVPLNDQPHLLSPANFVAQVKLRNDEEAIKVIDETARDVVNGELNPDTDHLQSWIARFGSSNIKGDPARAGETKIIIGKTEIVIPPQPPSKKEGGA